MRYAIAVALCVLQGCATTRNLCLKESDARAGTRVSAPDGRVGSVERVVGQSASCPRGMPIAAEILWDKGPTNVQIWEKK